MHGLYSAPSVLADLNAVVSGLRSIDGPILWCAIASGSHILTNYLRIALQLVLR
jgi:hypothetical protein